MKQLEWRVRLACAERKIWSASALRQLVYRRTGVALSRQTVEHTFHGLPARIDLRTLAAILNTLACPLEELVRFAPPQTEAEARATPEEAARYRRALSRDAGHALLPEGAARKQHGRTRSATPATADPSPATSHLQPNQDRVLAALAKGAAPVASERLNDELTQSRGPLPCGELDSTAGATSDRAALAKDRKENTGQP